MLNVCMHNIVRSGACSAYSVHGTSTHMYVWNLVSYYYISTCIHVPSHKQKVIHAEADPCERGNAPDSHPSAWLTEVNF